MYKVIHYFTDLQDEGHEYNVDDIYPRVGKKVNEERLTELSTNHNRQGKTLIEKVNLKELKVAELKALAAILDIKGYKEMKKSELIEALG